MSLGKGGGEPLRHRSWGGGSKEGYLFFDWLISDDIGLDSKDGVLLTS